MANFCLSPASLEDSFGRLRAVSLFTEDLADEIDGDRFGANLHESETTVLIVEPEDLLLKENRGGELCRQQIHCLLGGEGLGTQHLGGHRGEQWNLGRGNPQIAPTQIVRESLAGRFEQSTVVGLCNVNELFEAAIRGSNVTACTWQIGGSDGHHRLCRRVDVAHRMRDVVEQLGYIVHRAFNCDQTAQLAGRGAGPVPFGHDLQHVFETDHAGANESRVFAKTMGGDHDRTDVELL